MYRGENQYTELPNIKTYCVLQINSYLNNIDKRFKKNFCETEHIEVIYIVKTTTPSHIHLHTPTLAQNVLKLKGIGHYFSLYII